MDTLNRRDDIAPVTGIVLHEVERRRLSALAEARPGEHVRQSTGSIGYDDGGVVGAFG